MSPQQGFSSLNYFMQTKSRPRQEAQKISFQYMPALQLWCVEATACVLTHAITGALLPVQFGAFFQSSMAAAGRGLLAAALPPSGSSPARGCSSW